MCDKFVYDLSQEVEGTPNIFIRKDWINIMDNMNTNYQSNQSIIDTSQLSNSNKWMSYREAYLAVPLLLTITGSDAIANFKMNDYSFGLKNWFGSIIHSLTLDYNGTTIIQQTPFVNMWNIFRLLTSLSYNDVATMGATIGFYPDNFNSFENNGALGSSTGLGICNNQMPINATYTGQLQLNSYDTYQEDVDVPQITSGGNQGLTMRTKWIMYDPNAKAGDETYSTLLTSAQCNIIWKSYIFNGAYNTQQLANAAPLFQANIMAIIYLRHLASFFNMIPLLKGVFMKLTLNLNNASQNVEVLNGEFVKINSPTIPVGGVNPILIPSISTGSSWITEAYGDAGAVQNSNITYNLSVGSKVLGLSGNYPNGSLAQSIYLYVPAYSFNPTFEEAYLSSSPKTIRYTDIYQYQVLNQTPMTSINALVSNGIQNIKSVLIIPFLSSIPSSTTGGVLTNEWQSPFDTAGCGTTAPLVSLTNFNIQISGQNAIYNTQRYNWEEFVNQLYGENAVNGGMTDGLTSGLIDFMAFQNSACYYYVNVERMLPVEKSVPKSVQITGTNNTPNLINLWVFVEYETEVRIDLYTGARI